MNKRLDVDDPEAVTGHKKSPVPPPIAQDKLEMEAVRLRSITLNFKDFYNNKIIGDAEYRFAAEFQAQDMYGRKVLADKKTSECVKMFTTMIKNIQKDESLRYILTWLSDLLMDEDTLVKVAEFTPLPQFTQLLVSILFRNDLYAKHQSSMIIAKLAFCSQEQIDEENLMQYLEWCASQLSGQQTDYFVNLSRSLQYLLRRDCYRIPFYEANGVKLILQILDGRIDFQQQYQLIFCLWMLTFNEKIVNRIKDQPIVMVLSDVLRGTEKEKVKRIILATLRNMLEKPEKAAADLYASQMIHFKALRVLNILVKQTWVDTEIEEDITFLYEYLTASEQDLSSFDEYVHEVRSGRLEWSPVHKSEKFWRENVSRFNDDNYEILRLLVSILEESPSPVAVSVACFDIGEYVRYYPRGKKVIEQLKGKEVVMKLVVHSNSEVRMQALLAVQKMMVQNWEYLGKQLKGSSLL
ncbi:V-type proton ATPase subunit H-like isoform X2 [Dysidea avara]|uniref:V-type proton ATPase subunit H-like isoform X2 n=1 Tax=Dysidea avara TaxID=196820 RepID=UPI00332150E7